MLLWLNIFYVSVFLQQISLQSSSREFKEVEALFCKTMRGFDIINIERIQNQSLWAAFQLYVPTSS